MPLLLVDGLIPSIGRRLKGNLRTPCCQNCLSRGEPIVRIAAYGEANPSNVSYAFHSAVSTHWSSFVIDLRKGPARFFSFILALANLTIFHCRDESLQIRCRSRQAFRTAQPMSARLRKHRETSSQRFEPGEVFRKMAQHRSVRFTVEVGTGLGQQKLINVEENHQNPFSGLLVSTLDD